MSKELAALSNELAATVERTAPSVVAIHARHRYSSSGVIWNPGVIVTAEHTIRRDDEIRVTLPDGESAKATLAGADPGTDIAVLKLEGATAAIAKAAGPPATGNLAMVIGRSENSGPNAAMGIISAVSGTWRTWRGGRLDHYIRLDVTLFPGSSGGAVVNVGGETVGIATSVLSRIAGLAIPAANIDRVVGEILARGRVARGYLGVGLQPVEVSDHHKGLIVLTLEKDGPAAKAGVLIGDILITLGGAAVSETDDVQAALEGHTVGSPIDAGVLRGGVEKNISITIGERPRRG